MKLTNAIALMTLAAAAAMPLSAQQAVTTLNVAAQAKSAKGNKATTLQLLPPATVEKNVIVVREVPSRTNPEPEARQMSVKDFKMLLVQSPADYLSAVRAYNSGNLKEARGLLSKVRSKYEPFATVPGNPSLKAARMELDCLVRLMDWDAIAALVESSPGKSFLEAEDRVVIEAARLMGQVSDNAATAEARCKAIESFLADSKSKTINSDVYGWVKYAHARALASSIPAAELQEGISEAHAKTASRAVDAFCECVASIHWRSDELSVDALRRAFHILWAMPGVKSYALSTRKMDEAAWNAAPYNFRDAVAIAYLLENVYAKGHLKDATIQKAASFYFNRLIGAGSKADK